MSIEVRTAADGELQFSSAPLPPVPAGLSAFGDPEREVDLAGRLLE